MALTVTQPFADHIVGEVIIDAAQIEAILASDARAFVVRTPDPAPTAEQEAPKTA